MKRILYLTCIGLSAYFFVGCAKSVDRAQRDVQRARDEAAQDIHRKQMDLKETQQDASERVARQERRVEDATRQGNENIIKQQRELEDAQRAEAKRETDETATKPPITDRSAIDNNRPAAHVDVNVNRGPGGGVSVDVNPKP
jgi:hypothetical protein